MASKNKNKDVSQIGLQHPAFKVGKTELLNWVNDFYSTNYKKIEEMCDGFIYVQILDSIYPNDDVPLKKAKSTYKTEGEYIKNWKLVQDVLTKHGVKKDPKVGLVIQGKFQDNLAWLQWMKHFFDETYQGEPYDAVARRNGKKSGAGAKVYQKSSPRKKEKKIKPKSFKKTVKTKSTGKEKKSDVGLIPDSGNEQKKVDCLEKERNFYFSKLREIEVLCQMEDQSWANFVLEGKEISNKEEIWNEARKKFKEEITNILYQTDQSGEFQQPEVHDEGDQYEETF